VSSTIVLELIPGNTTSEAVSTLKELRNSWGSAPVIWDALCQKYYGCEPHGYSFDGTLDKLWPRYQDLSIPEYERAALMLTFDRAYVSKEHYDRMATDIGRWLETHPPKKDRVNHWVELQKIFESNPDCPAIGLQCTTVSDNPFHGSWDEEAEEYPPVDWGAAFEIYAELDALTSGVSK